MGAKTLLRSLCVLSLTALPLLSQVAFGASVSGNSNSAQNNATGTLDGSEVKPVGIVGFSFRYFGGEYPVVNDILPDGPASKLDIKCGDELTAVDGHDIALDTAHETRLALMGAPDTTVTIKLRRNGNVFEIAIKRLSSRELKNDHLRRAVEHYFLRPHNEKVPYALAHLAEPGPSVVEFDAGHYKNNLLAAKQKEGLSVHRIALSDPQYSQLVKKLQDPKDKHCFYYFTGIASDQGFFERRPLTEDRLKEDLEKIHCASAFNPMIEHFEKLREQSWSAPKETAPIGDKETETLLREANGTTVRFLKLLSQSGGGDEMNEILDGEAASLGLPPLGKVTMSSLLLVSPQFAVARLNSLNPCPVDIYCYLKHEKIWKITAFRSLSCTSALVAMKDDLTGKKLSEADQAVLANLNLTLSTDMQMRNWFFDNEAALNELAKSAKALKDDDTVRVDVTEKDDTGKDIAVKLSNLHLTSLNKLHNENVEIIIGGVGDNSVGLVYSPNDRPPNISPNEYIWVEKLKGHWYLFRTT
jgi:hypothetical protein